MDTDTRVVPRAHPARYSPAIMDVIRAELGELYVDGIVLDPFAGVGGIHVLQPDYLTWGIELEPEWAEQSALLGPTTCGDFFEFETYQRIAAVVTSCTYGNRMADHHNVSPEDTSKRITYTHALGRELSDNNSGAMGWGTEYRAFHIKAWIKVHGLLSGGGFFILNVKNHIRKGEEVDVAGWHRARAITTGFRLVRDIKVPVKGMGFGQNGQLRVDHERVFVFERVRDESHWNAEGQLRREMKREAGSAERTLRHGH